MATPRRASKKGQLGRSGIQFAARLALVGAFRAGEVTHLVPGVRQLMAAVQADGVAGFVQRKGAGLVLMRTPEQKFKAVVNHRVPPSRAQPNLTDRSDGGTDGKGLNGFSSFPIFRDSVNVP